MRTRLAVLLAAVLLPAIARAEEPPGLEDAAARASYGLGHQMGGDLERQGRQIDADALLRGLRDGLQGAAPALPPDEMNARLLELKRGIQAAGRESPQQRARRHRDEGAEFLAANAKREGVVALPSGLQYRVLKPGSGETAGPGDAVTVHYRATLIDGTEFHDSHRGGAPETFVVSSVVPGVGEALQLMRPGARWQLFLPHDLAYGERGPLADRTVVYEIELLSIESRGVAGR